MKWTELRKEIQILDEAYFCHFFLSESSAATLLTIHLSAHKEKLFSPQSWGMDPGQVRTFTEMLSRQQGVLLFVGLETERLEELAWACLKQGAPSKKHVMAVESHMETWLPGVDQFFSKGNSALFSELLSSALKHGPDVLLAGPLETRDHVEQCFGGALRGALVLGRLFAMDTADALLQIIKMGVEPFLIGSVLQGVVSKRTLRLNCQLCQEVDVTARAQAKDMGIPASLMPLHFYKSNGCAACDYSGFGGETSIFEVFPFSNEIKNLFNSHITWDSLRHLLKSSGFLSLRQAALSKSLNGQTSLAEVLRATPK